MGWGNRSGHRERASKGNGRLTSETLSEPGPVTADDLAALLAADPGETERFVRRHTGWMFAVAARILGDGGLAEDAVQNAYSNIFKSLATFQGQASLKTWMHRIVINEALMLARRQKRYRIESLEQLLPEFDRSGCRIEPAWTTIETPETLLRQTETLNTVRRHVDQLPDNYRIVLLLRDIEELSTADVANLLDLSEATVKIRLHRARAALKKLLQPLIGSGVL